MEQIFDEIHRKYPETTFSIVLSSKDLMEITFMIVSFDIISIPFNMYNIHSSQLYIYANKTKE